jgi:hypothetical protein
MSWYNNMLDWLFGRYKCPVCKKRFRTEAALNEHIRNDHREPVDINWG